MPDETSTAARPTMHSGGCQCGDVRYVLHAEPIRASICHCRMCQRAFGSYFSASATIEAADMTWTTAPPAVFASSTIVERGFCPRCGTPLSFRFTDRTTISVSIGSLDDPDRVRPSVNIGIEGRAAWLGRMLDEDGISTDERVPVERRALLRSRQHRIGEI